MNKAIRLAEKLDKIDGYWTPAIVAALNDYHVKLVKLRGEFTWHRHADTDELFLVLAGSMTICMRGRADVSLAKGELFVVPRGVEHKPVAGHECHILLLAPATTVNTGDAPGELTVEEPRWL